MCSISGFISKNPISEKDAQRLISALLFYGRDRGEQSGGVFSNGKLFKEAENPSKIIGKKGFIEVFKGGTNLAISHTRQPTCGGRGDAQAQPFQQGDVITIHNGSYWNIDELKKKWQIDKGSGVDSELITSFVQSHGVAKLPDFLESTNGVSAIVAKTPEGLFFATHGNPLHYCQLDLNEKNRILIWASTDLILEDALKYMMLMDKYPIEKVPDNGFFKVNSKKIKKIKDIKDRLTLNNQRWNNNRGGYYQDYDDWDQTCFFPGGHYNDNRYLPKGDTDKTNVIDIKRDLGGYNDKTWDTEHGMWRWWSSYCSRFLYEDPKDKKWFVEVQSVDNPKIWIMTDYNKYLDERMEERKRKEATKNQSVALTPAVETETKDETTVDFELEEDTKKSSTPPATEGDFQDTTEEEWVDMVEDLVDAYGEDSREEIEACSFEEVQHWHADAFPEDHKAKSSMNGSAKKGLMY